MTLKAIPDVHVQDMWIKPTLNEDNTSGAIRVDVKISAVKVGEKLSLIHIYGYT